CAPGLRPFGRCLDQALAIDGLVVMKGVLHVAEAFLQLALALIDLAADLGRLVAAELAGLFLDLAFALVPLAFDLVVHISFVASLVPQGTAEKGRKTGATSPARLVDVAAVTDV